MTTNSEEGKEMLFQLLFSETGVMGDKNNSGDNGE